MGILASKSDIKTFCHKHPKWNHYVFSVRDVNDWKQIYKYMFADGVIHDGRLQVLQQFTSEVVDHLMSQGKEKSATTIWQTYQDINTQLQAAGPHLNGSHHGGKIVRPHQ